MQLLKLSFFSVIQQWLKFLNEGISEVIRMAFFLWSSKSNKSGLELYWDHMLSILGEYGQVRSQS